MEVGNDIEEAIKVGDLVALFRPHGTLAQLAPPETLLAAPADDYVAGFVGFDRGIRRLSFLAASGLGLDTGPWSAGHDRAKAPRRPPGRGGLGPRHRLRMAPAARLGRGR